MPKLLILGGGAAGSLAAMYLSKYTQLGFEITLVDCKDYFEYTPSIIAALLDEKFPKKLEKITVEYTKLFEGYKIGFIKNKVIQLNKKYGKINLFIK